MGDIKILFTHFFQIIGFILLIVYKQLKKSKTVKKLLTDFLLFWKELMRFSLFAFTVNLLKDAFFIFVRFYSEIFITFAITFPTVILLLNFFENSIIIFLISLVPILLFYSYTMSSLYYCMEHRLQGSHVTLWNSFHQTRVKFFQHNYIFILYSSIVLIFAVIYFIFALFGSYVFDLFGIPSGESFTYWFFNIFLGTVFIIISFILGMTMQHAYWNALIKKHKASYAITSSLAMVKEYPGTYFFFYLLITLFFSALVWKSALSYLHLGITISTYFFINTSIFTSFLLWRQFEKADKHVEQQTPQKISSLTPALPFIVIAGFINYILGSYLVVLEYPQIASFVKEQQQNVLFSQQQREYVNTRFNYQIMYPDSWGVYEWEDGSVTFYHNSTGTVSGGLWLKVVVKTHDEKSFRQIYNYKAGVIKGSEESRDVFTKISNFTKDGYEGVAYSQIVDGQPYAEYQTFYVIHKGDKDYIISFTALTSESNSELFEKTVNTFSFIE